MVELQGWTEVCGPCRSFLDLDVRYVRRPDPQTPAAVLHNPLQGIKLYGRAKDPQPNPIPC